MEEVSLPIKTKIAAWWIAIFGGIIIIFSFWFFATEILKFPSGGAFVALAFILPVGLVIFMPSLFLLKRKKWSWYWAITALFSLMALATFLFGKVWILLLFIFINSLPPFILLLLDRKNFWKVAN